MKIPPTLRSLARQPGFCAVVILTLALGIGVNAAVFSIVDTMVFRGLPVPGGDRVLGLNFQPVNGTADARVGASRPEFRELRAAQRSFEDLALWNVRTTVASAPGRDPERVEGAVLTAGGMDMIQAPLALGRWFRAEEEAPGAGPTAVISDALWHRWFDGDPAVLGRMVRLDGEWATVIGVAANGFRFPETSDLWLTPRTAHGLDKRDQREGTVFGRVKPGVSVAAARAELLTLAERQLKDHPETGRGIFARVMPLSQVNIGSTDRTITAVMLGAVFLVLLIACGNAANLLLVRALARERELAVRSALGAARSVLVGLVFRETAVLAVAGALLGLGVGFVGIEVFSRATAGMDLPYWMVFRLDGRAVAWTLGAAAFCGLMAGLVPALRLTRPDLNVVLADAGRGSSGGRIGRFTGWLVVGQIGLSALLLVLSALTIRTVIKIQTLPLGFEPAGVFSGRVALPTTAYPEPARQREFHAALLERLRARPEVAEAALCDSEVTWDGQTDVVIDGRAPVAANQRGPTACLLTVTPGYFNVLGIGLLEGRDLSAADTATSQRVGLVSSAFAERHWPGESALGKRFRSAETSADAWVTVVGVVRNRMQGRFNLFAAPQVYVAEAQGEGIDRMTALVRARDGNAAALAPVLRAAVSGLDDGLPVYFAQPLADTLRKSHYNRRVIAGIFSVFGGAAAILAAIGLFGVTSHGVAQRRREIGIRMALGATPRRVLALVLGEGGWRLAVGLVLGLGGALCSAGLLTSILYGVTATDPVSFLATAAVLAGAAFFATLLPGLRAVRVPPAETLRAG